MAGRGGACERVAFASLKPLLSRAPFGMGDRTVLDDAVRSCWQVGHERVRILNKRWSTDTLTVALKAAKAHLGIPDEFTSRAALHKLLLYEAGGHFKPHKDSEKEAGMVASLIIVLPSPWEGRCRHPSRRGCGTRVVPALQEKVFSNSYSKCEHELDGADHAWPSSTNVIVPLLAVPSATAVTAPSAPAPC